MRRDRGQHVIARQEGPGLGIVEADVIGGMARRVQDKPFASGEFDHVAMLDVMRDGGKKFAATDGGKIEPPQALSQFGSLRRPFPGRRRRDALERTEKIAQGVLSTAAVALQHFHVDRKVVDRRFAVVIVGTVDVLVRPRMGMADVVAILSRRPAEVERAMRDDLGARFLVNSHSATEMIGVGVGDEDGVNVTRLEAGLL